VKESKEFVSVLASELLQLLKTSYFRLFYIKKGKKKIYFTFKLLKYHNNYRVYLITESKYQKHKLLNYKTKMSYVITSTIYLA